MEVKLYEQLDVEINGSFVDKYKNTTNEFHKKEINKYSVKELKMYYQKFSDLYNTIHELYIDYSNDDNPETKKERNEHLDMSKGYINFIENRYLNRINYKLNEKQTNTNVRIGLFSVILGFISIFIGVITTCDSKKNNDKNNQFMKQQDSIIEARHNEYDSNFNTIKHQNKQQLEIDSTLIKRIDNLGNQLDSVDKKLNKINLHPPNKPRR